MRCAPGDLQTQSRLRWEEYAEEKGGKTICFGSSMGVPAAEKAPF